MVDKSKLPVNFYEEIIFYFGRKEADRLIIKEDYNYISLGKILAAKQISRKIGFNINWTVFISFALAILGLLYIILMDISF